MTRTIIDSHVHTFVVGYQDTDQGRDALGLARYLAGPLRARIVAVVAYDVSVHLPDDAPDWERKLKAEAKAALDALDGVEKHAVGAPLPAHAILAVAEQEDAELIVLGSCHRGTIGRILMGSTSQVVLRDAQCPVAIAPQGYAARTSPHPKEAMA
jgi:nucleotide-binding universal stress UspA family protein